MLITQNECLGACEEILSAEIAKQRTFLGCYLQRLKPYSNGRASAQIRDLYNSYKTSGKSNTPGITAFKLYERLSRVCQYVEKKEVLNSTEHAYLKEIFQSNFLNTDKYHTGLDSKTLQRILNPEASLDTKENYFGKIKFIVTTVLPQMKLTPDFSKRLKQLPSTKKDIAEKLFTYNGKLVQFEEMDGVIEKLECWDKSEDCAVKLGQILEILFSVVSIEDDTDDNDSGEELLLDEAGFHKNSCVLVASHLAMFNIEIPAVSLSEFNRNIYQIISGTVYPAYINCCINENYTPSADSWEEGFKNDKIAAGLVLHGLHMDQQMHQSFCKRLEEIAVAERQGK